MTEQASNKLEIANDGSVDDYSRTFTINNEDHTLANALRYLLMKNPDVIFCGYTIPHPSEIKVNFKIQTNKKLTALQALEKGLQDLVQVCTHVQQTFQASVETFQSQMQT
jgi:DNA-directed RNA polymerase I and III subunit RPAC2